MRLAKLTASTAALLLSTTALMAQESQGQAMQSVFIDVGGTAILVPMDVALEACGLDQTTLQMAAQTRLDESGINQTQFMAQMDSAMGMMNQGDTATQDTAAAGTGTVGAADAAGGMSTDGTASADAPGAAAGAEGMDASGGVSDTTQTADANMTTDSGNATTDMGNTTTDMGNTTADASSTDSGAAATDTATADASGAASQDATAAGSVQNVQSTAADTTGDAGAMGSANADPFLVLAACQIDVNRATEVQIDMTRTGTGLGFDATTLGIELGMANQ